MKCDGTPAETRFRLSAKRTSLFKSAGASVQSPTCSRGVRVSGSNAGYTMFRGSVKSTGYPLHSPVSTSLPLSCVTVCHHISTVVYRCFGGQCCTHLQSETSACWSKLNDFPQDLIFKLVFSFVSYDVCVLSLRRPAYKFVWRDYNRRI